MFGTDVEMTALLLHRLSIERPATYEALHRVLAENDELPDMPLSAACRRVLAGSLDEATRAEVERLLSVCVAGEGAAS